MNQENILQLISRELEAVHLSYGSIILNKEKFVNVLNDIEKVTELFILRSFIC
jgi:hypothetical protein